MANVRQEDKASHLGTFTGSTIPKNLLTYAQTGNIVLQIQTILDKFDYQ